MAEEFLPSDQLPDCWNDEARINVLFAPFRDKSVNPKDWESKFDFWKNLIHIYCIHNRIYAFTYQELSKKFIKNGRAPACLNIVVEEMHKNGEIKPLHIFLQKPPQTWSGWITDNFVRRPINWSFTKVKDYISTSNTNSSYVYVSVVESESQKLLDNVPLNMRNKLVELMVLAKTVNYTNLDQLNILLHCLYCKGKLSIKTLQNKDGPITLLKFHEINAIKGISDRDVDIYTLEQSESALLVDIEKLEKQVIKLTDDAKAYLSKSQRQSAKSCLRKKKEIEKMIEKRGYTLHNIQTLLSRVEDAHTDTQILDAYKTALTRLRTTFNVTGLTEESVSNTMLELEETLEIHDGIQATLGQDTTVDSDIEKELLELLEDETGTTQTIIEQSDKADTDMDEIEKKLAALNILPLPPVNNPTKAKISL